MTLKKTLFYSVLILLPLLIMEGAFRLLPVSDPPHILAVSSENPVAHYQPNVDYRYSSGWNFSIRANKRSNNYGYINLSDYHPEEAAPLLMVIGDSYVESHSIEPGKSAAEILHRAVNGKGRVYSIGLSGAPLSQYLVFAEFSAATFRPSAMAFVIIENDFDESLLKYNADPRFHYFEENGDRFTLRRVDYEISTVKKILRNSAFVRYVWWNLQGGALRQNIQRFLCRSDAAQACSGETPSALAQRVEDSKRAVDHFLEQLPIKAKLDSKSIVFVLDAIRPAMYSPEALLQAESSYVSQMRRYFMKQASSRGYEVIDMQPAFMRKHQLDNSRFEFPTDAHWNALGNEIVAEEIRNSALFARVFQVQMDYAPARRRSTQVLARR